SNSFVMYSEVFSKLNTVGRVTPSIVVCWFWRFSISLSISGISKTCVWITQGYVVCINQNQPSEFQTVHSLGKCSWVLSSDTLKIVRNESVVVVLISNPAQAGISGNLFTRELRQRP